MSLIQRLSIRSLMHRMNNPAPKPQLQCLYFVKVSQLIKSYTNEGNYVDSHNECSHLHKRITKKHCFKCPEYKPIINE